MNKTAQDKFTYGETLNSKELNQLPIVDRCRYVVSNYFPKGFSVKEVHNKLIELNELNMLYSPSEIRSALIQFYGSPNE